MVALAKPAKLQPKARVRRKSRPHVHVAPNYWDLVADYERMLRGAAKSPETLRTYAASFKDFAAYLERERISLHIEAIQRPHIEAYIADILGRRALAASTAGTRYRDLRAFFNWLIRVDELDTTPMRAMHEPKGKDNPPQIISDANLAKLVHACDGRGFYNRRDGAMIRMLFNSGVRRGELCSMRHDDGLDMEAGTVRITGKTGTHIVQFDTHTGEALRSYIRARKRHPHADLPQMWLSQRGALKTASVNYVIARRSVEAGIDHINPHRFRHTWAHDWLADGGSEMALKALAGWSSLDMAARYGRSVAHERAIDEARRRKRGDRI